MRSELSRRAPPLRLLLTRLSGRRRAPSASLSLSLSPETRATQTPSSSRPPASPQSVSLSVGDAAAGRAQDGRNGSGQLADLAPGTAPVLRAAASSPGGWRDAFAGFETTRRFAKKGSLRRDAAAPRSARAPSLSDHPRGESALSTRARQYVLERERAAPLSRLSLSLREKRRKKIALVRTRLMGDVAGGEVTFAPKHGAAADAREDDGYLLTLLFDGRDGSSTLLVLDASRVADGPVSRVFQTPKTTRRCACETGVLAIW